MTYVFQSYSTGDVLTAAAMNQEEVNIRDHIHGASGVTGTTRTLAPEADLTYALGTSALRYLGVTAVDIVDTTVVSHGNSTTETTVFSYALPANLLGSNRAVALSMGATFMTGAPTGFTIRAKYGTSTFATAANTFSQGPVSGSTLWTTAILHAMGTTSLQGGTITEHTWRVTDFDSSSTGGYTMNGSWNIVTDSTTQQPISLTVQFSALGTPNVFQKRMAKVVRIF